MANPLHDLSELIHKLGDEVKNLADRVEHVFLKDTAPVEQEIKVQAEKAAQDAVKTAVEDVISK